MSTVQPATDLIVVNRGGVDYRTTLDKMSTLQDTDLLLVNRGGVDYRCTAADVKGAVGGGDGFLPEGSAPAGITHRNDPVYSSWPRYVTPGGAWVTTWSGSSTFRPGATGNTYNGKIAYETPFGYVMEKAYPTAGGAGTGDYQFYYDHSGRVQVPGVIQILTRQELIHNESNGGGLYAQFRCPRYGNGWWYLVRLPSTTGYQFQWMHYSNPSTDFATCNASRTSGYINANTIPGLGADSTFCTAIGGGRYGTDGVRFKVSNSGNTVYIFKDGAITVEGTVTGVPGSNNESYVLSDYVFIIEKDYQGNFGQFWRNTVKGAYNAWTPVVSDVSMNTVFLSGHSSDNKFYASTNGNYFMVGPGVILKSTDKGLTWKRYTDTGAGSGYHWFVDSHDLMCWSVDTQGYSAGLIYSLK